MALFLDQLCLLFYFIFYLNPSVFGIICPKGDSVNTNQHCIHLETNTLSWHDAEKYCVLRGGHLTSIHNQFDVSILRKLEDDTECHYFWTGGQCNENKICSWTDNTRFSFENWIPGEPRSSGCILSDFKTGKWKSTDCSTKECFVCEMGEAMTDCLDWYRAGYLDNGEYTVLVRGIFFKVYCDMITSGGGWTVFQRREDGREIFWNRTWNDYKDGFGANMQPGSEFWLGNEALHQLTTKDSNVTLRIEMRGDGTPGSKYPNGFWWTNYSLFRISSESSNYSLINLSSNWNQGNASSGWYDMTYSVGAPFSTIDKIHDSVKNCLTKFQMGGWWLHNCALATLNGAYNPIDWNNGYGIFWVIDGMDNVIHPRKTVMMLRANR